MSTKPPPSIDAELTKALEDSAYILMDEKKAEAYEKRSERIAELKAMLGHRSCF